MWKTLITLILCLICSSSVGYTSKRIVAFYLTSVSNADPQLSEHLNLLYYYLQLWNEINVVLTATRRYQRVLVVYDLSIDLKSEDEGGYCSLFNFPSFVSCETLSLEKTPLIEQCKISYFRSIEDLEGALTKSLDPVVICSNWEEVLLWLEKAVRSSTFLRQGENDDVALFGESSFGFLENLVVGLNIDWIRGTLSPSTTWNVDVVVVLDNGHYEERLRVKRWLNEMKAGKCQCLLIVNEFSDDGFPCQSLINLPNVPYRRQLYYELHMMLTTHMIISIGDHMLVAEVDRQRQNQALAVRSFSHFFPKRESSFGNPTYLIGMSSIFCNGSLICQLISPNVKDVEETVQFGFLEALTEIIIVAFIRVVESVTLRRRLIAMFGAAVFTLSWHWYRNR